MKKTLLYIVVLFSIVSCSSDSEFDITMATIVDGGNPALDGCGWLVRIDSENYKPVNLPAGFEVDDLAVTLTYEVLKEKGDCDVPNSIRQINIKKIAEYN